MATSVERRMGRWIKVNERNLVNVGGLVSFRKYISLIRRRMKSEFDKFTKSVGSIREPSYD